LRSPPRNGKYSAPLLLARAQFELDFFAVRAAAALPADPAPMAMSAVVVDQAAQSPNENSTRVPLEELSGGRRRDLLKSPPRVAEANSIHAATACG
jgi:hypothetical protein